MVDFLEVWHHLQISLQREKIICTPPKKNLSANDNVKVKVPVCTPGCATGVVGVMGMVGVVGVVGVKGPGVPGVTGVIDLAGVLGVRGTGITLFTGSIGLSVTGQRVVDVERWSC